MWCEVPGCKERATVTLRTHQGMYLFICLDHYDRRGDL